MPTPALSDLAFSSRVQHASDTTLSSSPRPSQRAKRALMPGTNPIGSRQRSPHGSHPNRIDHARSVKRPIHLARAQLGTTRVSSVRPSSCQIPARAVTEFLSLARNLCEARTRARLLAPRSKFPLPVLWVPHHILGVYISFLDPSLSLLSY